jgi:muramoyltetrapeptide carboxypeptidase
VPDLRQPHALRRGATLGIAAPGGPVEPERVVEGAGLLEQAGFRTWHRDDLFSQRGYLAGDDARRSAELMQLIEDPEIDGIVCARGGYGCDRILGSLDPKAFRNAAKPLVGYSDITALLLWQQRCAGLAGFHGPMLELGAGLGRGSVDALAGWLTGELATPVVLQGEGIHQGQAEGRLVGGSLTLVVSSLGTPWEIDTRGAILLLEEVHERPYRVDRMLQQLRCAGKLEAVAGIGFGDLSSCTDEKYASCVEEVIGELAESLRRPCLAGLPFGHVAEHATWPFGGRATIDGDRGEIRILERGVEVPS